MNFRFGSWPYPAGMPAHLYWAKSPMQVGKDRQWQLKVLFLGENGQYHEHIIPWGTVQSLKLGGVYIDGRISALPPAGEIKKIKLSNATRSYILSLDSLQNQWVDDVRKHKKELLWEHCVQIDGGETRIWVPCIELIRSFLAINKQLAYLLLEPSGLSRICTSNLEQEQVTINFTKEVPVTSLNNVFITRVATVLHHSDWWNSWQQVWNRSVKNSNSSTVYSRLFCCPPIIENSTWSVRGIETEKGFFVLEVLSFRTKGELPFSEVVYTHPRLSYSTGIIVPEGGKGSRNGTGTREESNTEGEIESNTKPPRNSKSPRQESIRVMKVVFGNKLRIVGKGTEGKPKIKRSEDPTPPKKLASQSKGPVPVSMDDQAGTGEIQAAEFKPIEMLASVPAGLKAFVAAVKKISTAKVGCTIEPVPDDSPLAKLGEEHRYFALVHIVGVYAGYILEVDSSDGREISTVVFSTLHDKSSLNTVNSLLTKCLSKKGHWFLENLGGELAGYELARHSSYCENWDYRLLTRLFCLVHKTLVSTKKRLSNSI